MGGVVVGPANDDGVGFFCGQKSEREQKESEEEFLHVLDWDDGLRGSSDCSFKISFCWEMLGEEVDDFLDDHLACGFNVGVVFVDVEAREEAPSFAGFSFFKNAILIGVTAVENPLGVGEVVVVLRFFCLREEGEKGEENGK